MADPEPSREDLQEETRLRPERIGAGTLYHLAIERGWKPDAALVLDGAAPKDAVHPAAGLLASITAPEPEPYEADDEPARTLLHVPPAPSLEWQEWRVLWCGASPPSC